MKKHIFPAFVLTALLLSTSVKASDPNSIVAWGNNTYFQCNVSLPNTDFAAMSGGYHHSLGLKQDGSIVAWGTNDYGQCAVPLPNTGFTAVAAGYFHSLGLKQDGSIVAWGNDSYNQCTVPSPNTGFVAIAAGLYHSLAIKSDGSVVAWGRNVEGQCSVPLPNAGFMAVSAGWYHSLGVKQDGSVVAWGRNVEGQCSVPSPNTGFATVAAGSRHSLGLKSDGSITAWGYNSSGQCDVPSPNTGFIGISAGTGHSLGLKSDGFVKAWGWNDYGQCSVPTEGGFVAVAGGWAHSLALSRPSVYLPDGGVNFSVTYQEIDGFGASGAWYEDWLTANPLKDEIYDVIFGQLGLDIYRVRNTYQIDSGYIDRTAQIVAGAASSLGHPVKVMISSWSPPAYLKSNGSTIGGTLKKDTYGNYMYGEFAQWWADSLAAFESNGINAAYINMQNEPDWTADWDTCLFDPTENSANAGYQQGFAALYANLNSMPSRPKLLAPEGANISGTGSYINAMTSADKSNIYGYAHHPYDGSADAPDMLISAMADFKTQYGDRPLLQTEFARWQAEPLTFTDAMNLARLMHNFLTIEGVSAYLYWELFWEPPKGLVSVTPSGYTINTTYYAFKHYSAFTDPGWHRVEAFTYSGDLRISAFKSPDGASAAIVIINVSDVTDVNLLLPLSGFTPSVSGVYQTTSSASFAYIGALGESQRVFLPRQSITTIHLTSFTTCADVQNAGHRLLADLNGDCYVNYEDLDIMAEYWLYNDCFSYGGCNFADFPPADGDVDFIDFSKFGLWWMQCNDPQNAGCMHSW